jgi:BirA family biotin operon repressor/biotin-[acetyl-CoA-carboxylase] ligase
LSKGGVAHFRPLCDDPPAVSERLDLDRLQALLRTEFIGRRVFYDESVPTTMEIARREAQAGAPEGTIAIAEEQTAGRGRMGRTWVSPPGVNLYFTLILRPTIEQLRYLAVIAPLAVCQAIEETVGLLPRIKWPNDVAINDKKVCGVLTQSEIADGAVLYALIGPGINVNMDVVAHEEIRGIATSLRAELGRAVAREEVLAATLNHLETLYKTLRRGEVVSMAWKHRLDTLGKHVRVSGPDGRLLEEGVAVDADSDGSLILRRDDGSHVRVEAGEVTLRES